MSNLTNKPTKGQRVFGKDDVMLGTVDHVNGNICYYLDSLGNSDCFIWKFEQNTFEPEQLNNLISWR